MLTLLRNRQII